MSRPVSARGGSLSRRLLVLCLLFWLGGASTQAAVVPVLDVRDNNNQPLTNYRWLIEEDTTHAVVPGQSCLNGDLASCPSVDFHRSYAPPVAEGHRGTPLPALDPQKRYFVSVLPDAAGSATGAGLGAAPLKLGETTTVVVNRAPIPTAQITISVFHDHYPINNAPDTPEEQGLAGFQIILSEAGGRYGMSGGQVSQDAFGNPLGVIETGPDGSVTIRNLMPAKYGIEVVPPTGEGWIQTSTIEGTRTIDAWVKANEPAFFTEFGPPGPHVAVGFVKAFNHLPASGGATLTGQIRQIHNSRPPDYTFHTGAPAAGCWVGLNDQSVGNGKGVFAAPCDADSRFHIPNVPAGSYQLAVWDENLDLIFANLLVNVDAQGNCNGAAGCDLREVPVFTWFARLENYVFNDSNANGIWDAGEPPLPEVPVNLRFRDGSLYLSMATDMSGAAPFEEVFPFFSWLVAEVDNSRFEATGATVVVDDGGAIDPAHAWSFDGVLKPQPQAENGGAPYRVETGPVLTQGFQAFLGQTNVIQWGKKAYDALENGGISGIVYYATTRAENDPRFAVAEPWEPGIPRIQVALYQDHDNDSVIDDLNQDGGPTLTDVDNYPFDWRTRGTRGSEDVDHDGNGAFDAGDAIQITTTDSWDDSRPAGCQGAVFHVDGDPQYPIDCYDGLRNFNQVRPAVFDGGYAFNSHHPDGIASGSAQVQGLQAGTYIVGIGDHPAYTIVREEDRNVDFGEAPAPQLQPPLCVGDAHTVPGYLSRQLNAKGKPLSTILPADLVPAPYARTSRPLCDRRKVTLNEGQNSAADFFLFTQVPIAGHIYGMILDDLANEFDPASPMFSEKYSPPFLPVSIRDWTGRELSRTYSDRWGRFSALVPSTFTANVPMPSGMSPSMLVACMNSPASDPHYNPQYSQFCYTLQYMPGTTTYLDTPVVPVSAFTGPDQFPLDCDYPADVPVVSAVSSPLVALNDVLTIRGSGFGGKAGKVTVGGGALDVLTWGSDTITARVGDQARTGQLVVVPAHGKKPGGVGSTIVVNSLKNAAGTAAKVWEVNPVAGATPIQDAIDAAQPGDLVLVHPGTYEELVILWKPVRLQGFGADTRISAVKAPGEKLAAWRLKVEALVTGKQVDLLPGQQIGFGGIEPDTLFYEEGSGILVLARKADPAQGGFGRDADGLPLAWIDGFAITGADHAGGIVVNGYAHHLAIGNNRVHSNVGVYGGGIRVGHPNLEQESADGLIYQDGHNDHIRIHHNWVSENASGVEAAGGGISLYHGTHHYAVTDNFVCGNFTQGHGGGIGHLGLSRDGTIKRNTIVFNQAFDQGTQATGGGLFIGGANPLAPAGVSPGAGSVRVVRNLIQGNLAGAGDGGGLRLVSINGQDVAGPVDAWYTVELSNNLVVNNVTGLAGGGLSLQDALRVALRHNTIAHNDSTATAGGAFAAGSPNQSTAQPAGVVSHRHSPALAALLPATEPLFSNPLFENNVIWHNRSFHFAIDPTQTPPRTGLLPDLAAGAAPLYWDQEVIGAKGGFSQDCALLSGSAGDPAFVAGYVNHGPPSILYPEPTTSLAVMPAFDEGGNFIDVHYGPLTLQGSDYHIGAVSAARDRCPGVGVPNDFDGATRPSDTVDAGADEIR